MRGFGLGVDIHHTAWVEGVDDCRLLLDSMPCENAGIILNIGHITSAEGYGWLLVDEYPNRIPVVGWKDQLVWQKIGRARCGQLSWGTGHSPFELYIKAFKRHSAARVHLINCENVPDEGASRCVTKESRIFDDTLGCSWVKGKRNFNVQSCDSWVSCTGS